MYCDNFFYAMNSSLMLKAIASINEGNFSVEELAVATGLGKSVVNDLIKFLERNGIGSISSDSIEFGPLDKMYATMLAIQMGTDIEDISKMLNWKDFEVLARNLLDASGFVTRHALRLKKPGIEIDVVGIKDRMALLIDCKHWKREGRSALNKFALMQIHRAEAFIKVNKGKVRFAVPAILTLHLESVIFANDVPIVPIIKFRSFLNELTGYLNEIKVVHG